MKMKKMRDQYVTLLLKVLKLQLQTTHRAASWKEGGASAVDMIFSFFPFSLQIFNLYLLIKSQSPWDQFISPKRIRNNILFFLALERIIIRQLLYAPRFFCAPLNLKCSHLTLLPLTSRPLSFPPHPPHLPLNRIAHSCHRH